MTQDEITIRLMLLEPILATPKAYAPAETAEMYSVYNAITNENRRPNGCGACLNAVITRLKKEIRNIKRG
jgi:hypothetical protein